MSGAEGERLRRASSQEASYRTAALLKCTVCLALIGLLVLIVVHDRDDRPTTVTTMSTPTITGAAGTDLTAAFNDHAASPRAGRDVDPERRVR